ncbi:hypothetical protein [Morganella morganii]|uniref:hypothetical protein n=1 Tax=Morganella morganii TaxID=582 RepID=UPI0021A30518|nr:hypothetical protein [Morganella morganii]
MKYKDKLESAIAAATKANNNKDEISNVIKELSMSIEEFSNGNATLTIASQYRKKINSFPTALASAAEYLAGLQNETYQAILLQDTSGKIIYELAEWRVPKEGYPVNISYGKRDIYCSNRAELEEALANIIGSVTTGDYLLKIMNNHHSAS